METCAYDAPKGGLGRIADRFCPAECFFDPFAVPGGQGAARVPGDTIIGSHQIRLHNQPAAVLHEPRRRENQVQGI